MEREDGQQLVDDGLKSIPQCWTTQHLIKRDLVLVFFCSSHLDCTQTANVIKRRFRVFLLAWILCEIRAFLLRLLHSLHSCQKRYPLMTVLLNNIFINLAFWNFFSVNKSVATCGYLVLSAIMTPPVLHYPLHF